MNRIIQLNENWMLKDGNNSDSEIWLQNGIPQTDTFFVDLPCFTHMAIEDHVGISYFEKRFALDALPDKNTDAILFFERADFRCEVSVNGTVIGVHTGAEDPFSFIVTHELLVGENRITVRISKPYGEMVDGYTFDEIPHRNQAPSGIRPGLCYNESGICGEVSLRFLPKVRISDLALFADPDTGLIRVEVSIIKTESDPVEGTLELEVRKAPEGDVEDTVSIPVKFEADESAHVHKLHIEKPQLWSLKDPCLYTVRAEIGTCFGRHSAVKKTGFRSFRVGDDGYFYLNGEKVYVRSSHTGNCFPESYHDISRDRELLRKDFLMAKSVGFNMIRFIAGSALPLQLDLCDEIGLMVYEEPLGAWLEFNGPHAAELYRNDLLSMVKRDRSHPSVTIWGLLNETNSTPPYDEVCNAARGILPELRRLDDTRLVLFSSGRWDKLADTGSVSNPGQRDWQTLWGWEGNGFSPDGLLGDVHIYPSPVPMQDNTIRKLRSFTVGAPYPFFISEIGIGSALDTVSLVRKFDRMRAIPFSPDVKLAHKINDCLLKEIHKFGFSDFEVFPSELMLGSMKNHAYYRTQLFDILRSNPRICGLSLTGLLDHSIVGEGFWTLFREFKPMIADVLQDGFASLRWCILLSQPALFSGIPLRTEAFLASENSLKPGCAYEARAGIIGKDGHVYESRLFRFSPTDEQVCRMVIPVFDESWETSSLPEGEYRFRVELVSGGYASDSTRVFHVMRRVSSRTGRRICAMSLTGEEEDMLFAFGFELHRLGERESDLIIAGHIDKTNHAALENELKQGTTIVSLRSMDPDDITLTLLPEERRPHFERTTDWLYHRETVLRPGGRFFEEMQAGLADAILYTGVLTQGALEANEKEIPDETDAFSFETGCSDERGFVGGFKLGSYKIGKGELIINTLNLLDSAASVPYAARLLVNLLDRAGMNHFSDKYSEQQATADISQTVNQ